MQLRGIRYLRRMFDLRERLELRYRLCDSDCDCGCIAAGAGAGWIVGYEFLWLKPHFSEGINYQSSIPAGQTNIYATEEYGYQTDFNLAPRVWIGYQTCSGFAARLRYWQFDHSLGSYAFLATAGQSYYAPSTYGDFTATDGDTLAIQNGMKADVIDFDLTQDFNWGHTRLTLGGGLSYAGLRMDRYVAMVSGTTLSAEARASRFQGIGPTALAELKRQVGNSGFSVVGSARGTVLFGREKVLIGYASTGQTTELRTYGLSTNRCRGIIAATIGVQYDREILNGIDAFARLSWEGQYWSGFGNPTGPGGDLAFQGIGISAGIRR